MEGRAERPRSAAAAYANGSGPTRAAKHSQVSIGLIQAKTLPSMAPPLEGAAVSDSQARYRERMLQKQQAAASAAAANAMLSERVTMAESRTLSVNEQLGRASSQLASMRSVLAREQVVRQRAEDLHQITLQDLRVVRDENDELKSTNRALLEEKQALLQTNRALHDQTRKLRAEIAEARAVLAEAKGGAMQVPSWSRPSTAAKASSANGHAAGDAEAEQRALAAEFAEEQRQRKAASQAATSVQAISRGNRARSSARLAPADAEEKALADEFAAEQRERKEQRMLADEFAAEQRERKRASDAATSVQAIQRGNLARAKSSKVVATAEASANAAWPPAPSEVRAIAAAVKAGHLISPAQLEELKAAQVVPPLTEPMRPRLNNNRPQQQRAHAPLTL